MPATPDLRAQATEKANAMIAALRYLADPESWGGDPREQGATLYGHDTPLELAARVLAEGAAPDA